MLGSSMRRKLPENKAWLAVGHSWSVHASDSGCLSGASITI
jgi:hypothetical protein